MTPLLLCVTSFFFHSCVYYTEYNVFSFKPMNTLRIMRKQSLYPITVVSLLKPNILTINYNREVTLQQHNSNKLHIMSMSIKKYANQ
jgi:hypothetical protein